MAMGSIFDSIGNALNSFGDSARTGSERFNRSLNPSYDAALKQQEQQAAEDLRRRQSVSQIGQVLSNSQLPADAIQKLAAIGTPEAIAYAQQLYEQSTKSREGFTLGEGQRRFDSNGRLVAEAPKAPEAITPYQAAQLDISRQNLELSRQKSEQEKAPNKEQSDAALYASRMIDANNTLQKVIDSGFEPARGRDWVPNGLKSEAGQLYDQTQRNFISAVLRRESGAAISDSEFENAQQQYFPQPGDDPKTLAQKAENRLRAIEGISNAAGPAKKNIPGIQGGLTGLTALPAGYKDLGNGFVLGPDNKKYKVQQD